MKIVRAFFAAAVLLAAATPVHAQTQSVAEMLRSDIRADAQKITAVGMMLPDDQAEKFWPIYREYELERAKWGDERIALIKSYAEQFENMNDDASAELLLVLRAIAAAQVCHACPRGHEPNGAYSPDASTFVGTAARPGGRSFA